MRLFRHTLGRATRAGAAGLCGAELKSAGGIFTELGGAGRWWSELGGAFKDHIGPYGDVYFPKNAISDQGLVYRENVIHTIQFDYMPAAGYRVGHNVS